VNGQGRKGRQKRIGPPADSRHPGRGGFSLLEVLMAMGILLGCVIVLTELAAIGRAHATDAEILAKAQLLCQTRLNEMLAGAQPVMPVQDRTLDEEPGWEYSVKVDSVPYPGLVAVRVVVAQDVPEGQRGKRFSLVRWTRDPHGRLAASAGETAEEAGDEAGNEE